MLDGVGVGVGVFAKLKLPVAIIDCEPFNWPGVWNGVASSKRAVSLFPADMLKYVEAWAST